jgi:amidase
MLDDLLDLDATAQAEAIRRKDVDPAELLDATLDRIDARDPQLNAVIHRLDDKARAAIADGLPDGPFRGVPMLVKDCVCHTAGDPFHNGMRVLKEIGWTEPDDAALARRFRAAGFVICGKTNLPELAMMVTTEPLAYGATHNPWDLTRTPGGSSGGAGAAVGARLVAVAHGNDMGGSIRIPSSCCGLVGLKPTRARASLAPSFGEYWAMTTHEFVLVRSVRDAAGVLDAVAGPEPGDPYTAPAPRRPWREEPGGDPGRLRIGVRTRSRSDMPATHADCVAAVEATARQLEALGHTVEPVDAAFLDDPAIGSAQGVIFPVAIARELVRWSARTGRTLTPGDLEPQNAVMAEFGAAITGAEYVAAIESAQSWARRAARFWYDDRYDLLLTPTIGEPPFRLGVLAPNALGGGDAMNRAGGFVQFVAPFNLTGQPAISLPTSWNDADLPVGVQLVAAYGREDVLLRVGAQLEASCQWEARRPPIAAA